MDFKPRSHEKIQQLMDKGVDIPSPATLDIGDDVRLDQISGKGVKMYPGCRIYGNQTVVSSGCQLGYEAPVTMENCQLGANVELKGGFFHRSVFLEKSSMGLGAHVREGCLIEEQASGAHCVGLKQTILFPFVTLGSLVNFCDCLMAGGTSRRNHSEVGSSYIHFNFTPEGDKATPSLIGDVPKGVMLNQPPIFLGGQGGLIGPLRIGYGNVVAAGSILRKNYDQGNQLIFAAGPARSIQISRPAPYADIMGILENNLLYLANLKALEQWYINVRKPFLETDKFGSLLYRGAADALSLAVKERLQRLNMMAKRAAIISANHQDQDVQVLSEHIDDLENILSGPVPGETINALQDDFLNTFAAWRGNASLSYLDVMGKLPSDISAKGVRWLQNIVDYYCQKTASVLSSPRLFKRL
ncbi:MAG: UDP-N-acetylglucosamine pyrophosphorylase [Smithellaceae bacterium]